MDISLLRRYVVGYAAAVFGSFLLASPFVPFTRPFSVVALSAIGIANALVWLFVAHASPWRSLGACVNLLCFLLSALSIALDSMRYFATLSAFLFAVVLGNSISWSKLPLSPPFRRFFLIHQLVFLYVSELTLYLREASVTFPSRGWGGNAMTARLLFWPALLMAAIWAVGAVSRWQRLYTVLCLAGLAQIGNGMMDLWGILGRRWLSYAAVFLWVVFLTGLLYLGIVYLVRARNRIGDSPSPPQVNN